MTNEEAKRYMQSKYNCDLLTINGVVLVPLYQIIDRIEQPAPAVPLDRIKEAREEIRKLDDINPDYPMDRTIHVSRNEVLAILDKLIAEVEGTK